MTNNTEALKWWRSMTDAERLTVTLNSPRNRMFAEEVDRLGTNSLTSRMIREIYEDNQLVKTTNNNVSKQNMYLVVYVSGRDYSIDDVQVYDDKQKADEVAVNYKIKNEGTSCGCYVWEREVL